MIFDVINFRELSFQDKKYKFLANAAPLLIVRTIQWNKAHECIFLMVQTNKINFLMVPTNLSKLRCACS